MHLDRVGCTDCFCCHLEEICHNKQTFCCNNGCFAKIKLRKFEFVMSWDRVELRWVLILKVTPHLILNKTHNRLSKTYFFWKFTWCFIFQQKTNVFRQKWMFYAKKRIWLVETNVLWKKLNLLILKSFLKFCCKLNLQLILSGFN